MFRVSFAWIKISTLDFLEKKDRDKTFNVVHLFLHQIFEEIHANIKCTDFFKAKESLNIIHE